MLADRLEIWLVGSAAEYRDLDAIADAWFAQVLGEVLAEVPRQIERPPADQRLLRTMTASFEHLAPHALVSRDMLRLKLNPSHPHHGLPMVFDLSRLMHWFLDGARIEGRGAWRALRGTVITGIFPGALARWAWPRRPDAERAGRYLRRRLRLAALFADRGPRLRPATS